ncbi:amidase [Pacificimonas flava]|uniref:Amidase n=2 Tax=Pacificimonas TaxID=1960290 RepID=A0A219B994_9SPHN|nr:MULTISPECIES: amidase [Pacificimonas]MBZ6378926.1 amidase [Pacificimonas aurantium]OWV34734.1 amidase [Pacificimonas flava]
MRTTTRQFWRGALAGLAAMSVAAAAQASEPGPAEQALREALVRIERHDPKLNAVLAVEPTAIDEARALDRADGKGPLYGEVVLLKDNIEAKGLLPTTAGSLALSRNVTGRDAPLVERLREAGAVIAGKTNLSEWANFRSFDSLSGWSAVGGQTRNPHALDRSPCGSSSGSGAAVAAGLADMAVGTETNGSITCPASMNGIVGFKPTVGLVSRTHIVPISAAQDTAGPMTRSVLDAARMLNAMAGTDPADEATSKADDYRADYVAAVNAASLEGTRLGVMRFAAGFQTGGLFDKALEVLRSKGAVLVEIEERGTALDDDETSFRLLLLDFKSQLNDYLAGTPGQTETRSLAELIAFNQASERELRLFGQNILELAEDTQGRDEPDYEAVRSEVASYSGPDGIDRLLAEHRLDALIGPTTAPAMLIDSVHGDSWHGGGAGYLAAHSGYPHLTVPMGLVKGLPVGLSFIGAKWEDAKILALGAAYEEAAAIELTPAFRPSLELENPALDPRR